MIDIKSYIRNVPELICNENDTLLTSIKKMNNTGDQIIIVLDKNKHIAGILTIGDVLRAIIETKSYDVEIKNHINKNPLFVVDSMSIGEVFELIKGKNIKNIPVVDEKKHYVGILAAEDLKEKKVINCPVVIMAGGLGTRMKPLTDNMPKPLLPLYDKPIIQHIIENFRKYGVHKYIVSVNYQKEKIKNFLKDGKWLKVSVEYIEENKKLGTAGALGLKDLSQFENVIVINGDVITNLNFQMMYDFHTNNVSDVTIAVKNFEINVPYGMVQMELNRITSIVEKPTLIQYINAGIYIMKTEHVQKIKKNEYLDMPDFVRSLISDNKRVYAFQIEDDWIDLGSYDEYIKINKH